MSNQITPQITYAALLGQVLQKHREAVGLHQVQLAEALGISQPAYSRIEQGGTGITVLQFRKVCHKMAVAPGVIMNQVEWWIGQLNGQGVLVVEEREVPKAALLVGLGVLAGLLVLTAAQT